MCLYARSTLYQLILCIIRSKNKKKTRTPIGVHLHGPFFVHMAMKLQSTYYTNYCTGSVCVYTSTTTPKSHVPMKVLITCRHMDGLPLSQQSNANFPRFIKRASYLFSSLQLVLLTSFGHNLCTVEIYIYIFFRK